MRKSLLVLAALPIAGALATVGAGSASATISTNTGAESAVQLMANCDAIGRLSDRAEGKCYDTAFRVGVRCGPAGGGTWQTFFSPWTQKNETAVATCPPTWPSISADYDFPE